MRNLHQLEIKLVVTDSEKSAQTEKQAMELFESLESSYIKLSKNVSLKELSGMIKNIYPECEIQDSVRDGCYGMRPGTSSKGLTVWLDAYEWPKRWFEKFGGEYTEWCNPLHLMEDSNWRLVDIEDPSELFDALDPDGSQSKSDNSYNWGAQSETVLPIFDYDFSTLEMKDGKFLVLIKFHYGGDIRGNYGKDYLFIVESEEELYSVFSPCFLGECENE